MRESAAGRVVIVAARNEAERIRATLDALAEALPGARLLVADDASSDDTPQIALRRGAWVVSRGRPHGKGANVTAAAQALGEFEDEATVLLCDADLGESAGRLVALVEAIEAGEWELVLAGFADRPGGGFGVTLGYARRLVERVCDVRLVAPLSGQRAMRLSTLRSLLPFADGGPDTGWGRLRFRWNTGSRAARRPAFCTAPTSCATSGAPRGLGPDSVSAR